MCIHFVSERVVEQYGICRPDSRVGFEGGKYFSLSLIHILFLMSREENMTYREIAARCGIGEKAVERHIHLTFKFLKKNLLLFILCSMLPE